MKNVISNVTLINLNSPAHSEEPSVTDASGSPEHHRDGIHSAVRACLLRGRDLSETLRQIGRKMGYNKQTTELAKFFFINEVCKTS